jgi:transposase-like protein
LYRAVDRDGDTIDFRCRAERDRAASYQLLERSIALHDKPAKMSNDKSGANNAAIDSYSAEHEADVALRQSKYLNNLVKQDHKAITRILRPVLGLESLRSARFLCRRGDDPQDSRVRARLPRRTRQIRDQSVYALVS